MVLIKASNPAVFWDYHCYSKYNLDVLRGDGGVYKYMDSIDIKSMRRKQTAVTNALIISLLTLFFLTISIFDVTFSVFFFTLGGLLLIQAVIGLLKNRSTHSFIPIFQQVANYEKQKMGKEWQKQRRMDHIWRLILSGILFFQYYLNQNSGDAVVQIDFIFMLTIALITIILINISLLLHISKVDSASSESDLKGYTWKTNLLAIVIGIVVAFLLFFFLLFYIISTI